MELNGQEASQDREAPRTRLDGSGSGADLESVLTTLRDRWILIVACVILAGALAFVASERAEKKYTAAAKLLFRDPGFDQNLFGATVFPASTDPDRAAATNRQTVELSETFARAAKKLDDTSAADLKSSVKAVADGNSDFVSVEATTPVATRSAKLANVVAASFVRWRRKNDVDRIEAAQEMLASQLADPDLTESQSRAIRSNIEELQLLASVQTGNVEFAQRASVPGSPSSPKTHLNVLLGLGLGLLLGLCLAFFRARVDRRLKGVEDIAQVTALPVLGEVGKAKDGPFASEDEAVRDAFYALRSRLRYFNVDRKISTILVGSASSGEGKSFTASHLAAAAAGLGERVLLVEVDFRRPVLAERLGVAQTPGLSGMLTGGLSRDEAVVRVDATSGTGAEIDRGFDLLPAGGTPPSPQVLIESKGMTALIDSVAVDYDLVIVDAPPVLHLPDTLPLIRLVDGILLVCRCEVSTRNQLRDLVDEIQDLDGNPLGIALNAVKRSRSSYGYGYGYGYSASNSESKLAAIPLGRRARQS